MARKYLKKTILHGNEKDGENPPQKHEKTLKLTNIVWYCLGTEASVLYAEHKHFLLMNFCFLHLIGMLPVIFSL